MTKAEQKLIELISEGQSGDYDKSASIIRNLTGKIRKIIELKNPLLAGSFIIDIDYLLQVINPQLTNEIDWLKKVQKSLKLWCNDIIMTNRLLGIKNDNTYDYTVFEKLIMNRFFLKDKPTKDTIIQTDFETMVELIEMGVRRF